MEQTLSQIISQNLKYEIEHSGKTKTEIARAIGVSCPTVTQYCTGQIQPTLETLSKLCKYLDISSDEILAIKK